MFWGKCLIRKLKPNCWLGVSERFYHSDVLWVNKARKTNFTQLMFAVQLWPLLYWMTLNICYGKKWYHFNFRLHPHLARERIKPRYHILSRGLWVPARTSPWGSLFWQGFSTRIRAGFRTRPVHNVTQLTAIQHNLLWGCWALCFIRKQNISFPHH